MLDASKDNRSREAQGLITYCIKELGATEDNVRVMISKLGVAVDKKIYNLVKASTIQPASSSKNITVVVAKNGNGLKSHLQVDTPNTPEVSPPVVSVRKFVPDSPLRLMDHTSEEEDNDYNI